MIGRRTAVGLALLCALMFSALAAQGAVAQVGTQAVNTTAVTCVKGGTDEEFEDPHCTEYVGGGNGEYGHESIPLNTTTELEISKVGSTKINGIFAGVNTEIICNKAVSVPEKSFIHNVEPSSKQHTVTGSVQINLSACEVIKPAKCIVTDILLTANVHGVEGLGPNNDTMGVEFIGTGETKTLAEITFHDKPPEKCSLNNNTKPFVLRGTMIATGETFPIEQYSGATWVFEDKNEMETLEVGLKKASLAATFTPSMTGGGNPIALTTTT